MPQKVEAQSESILAPFLQQLPRPDRSATIFSSSSHKRTATWIDDFQIGGFVVGEFLLPALKL